MEEKLKLIFANINDWLKFAEAKNAALITVDGAALFCVLNIFNENNKGLEPYKYVLIALSAILLASVIIAFVSFIAKIKNMECKGYKLLESDNLTFYGHICKYSAETYLKAIYKKYEVREVDYDTISNFEKDLANQIIVNSQIVLKKIKLFNKGVLITLAGVIITIIGFILITCYK